MRLFCDGVLEFYLDTILCIWPCSVDLIHGFVFSLAFTIHPSGLRALTGEMECTFILFILSTPLDI